MTDVTEMLSCARRALRERLGFVGPAGGLREAARPWQPDFPNGPWRTFRAQRFAAAASQARWYRSAMICTRATSSGGSLTSKSRSSRPRYTATICTLSAPVASPGRAGTTCGPRRPGGAARPSVWRWCRRGTGSRSAAVRGRGRRWPAWSAPPGRPARNVLACAGGLLPCGTRAAGLDHDAREGPVLGERPGGTR